jgi:hypothetical protein
MHGLIEILVKWWTGGRRAPANGVIMVADEDWVCEAMRQLRESPGGTAWAAQRRSSTNHPQPLLGKEGSLFGRSRQRRAEHRLGAIVRRNDC